MEILCITNACILAVLFFEFLPHAFDGGGERKI